MQIKKIAVAVGIAVVAVTSTGCASSKRNIDVQDTGSVRVEGTSWYRFCDGPNAVIWVKGYTGDPDEIEAYVYDHPACAPAYYQENPDAEPQIVQPTEDGLTEDED